MKIDDCFYLGFFRKSSGHKNIITLEIDTDEPEKYEKLESVFVQLHKKDNHLIPFFISSVISRKKNLLSVQMESNAGIEVTSLMGKEVYLPLSSLPELKGNKFYFHEVVNFSVTDISIGEIGKVQEVLQYPAQDVLRILENDTEILVPILEDTIVKVNREQKSLTIQTPEGLVEMYRN